jgi:hypothetical protein
VTDYVVTVTGRRRPDVFADRERAEQFVDAVYTHGGEAVLSEELVLTDDEARALIADAATIAAGTPA